MRYFFDLVDGDIKPDIGGVLFDGDGAASQEARLRAIDYAISYRLERYDGYRAIRVRDETGRIVCEVAIEN